MIRILSLISFLLFFISFTKSNPLNLHYPLNEKDVKTKYNLFGDFSFQNGSLMLTPDEGSRKGKMKSVSVCLFLTFLTILTIFTISLR